MEGEAFDPNYLLGLFALTGLGIGWAQAAMPERHHTSQVVLFRWFGIVMIAAVAIDLRTAPLAWPSVLHFVLKYLGTYHGCRLLSWAVAQVLIKVRLIRVVPDQDRPA